MTVHLHRADTFVSRNISWVNVKKLTAIGFYIRMGGRSGPIRRSLGIQYSRIRAKEADDDAKHLRLDPAAHARLQPCMRKLRKLHTCSKLAVSWARMRGSESRGTS